MSITLRWDESDKLATWAHLSLARSSSEMHSCRHATHSNASRDLSLSFSSWRYSGDCPVSVFSLPPLRPVASSRRRYQRFSMEIEREFINAASGTDTYTLPRRAPISPRLHFLVGIKNAGFQSTPARTESVARTGERNRAAPFDKLRLLSRFLLRKSCCDKDVV